MKKCKVNVSVAQSCPTLCDPTDSSVHGIFQARVLEWVAISFSRGSSQPRDPPKKQQHYCWVMAVSVGSTTSGENIACLLLWLLHRPGEDKLVCSSYGSSSFLPASLLAPCLPWVQRTVYTVRHRKTTGVTYRISNSAYTGNKKSEKE